MKTDEGARRAVKEALRQMGQAGARRALERYRANPSALLKTGGIIEKSPIHIHRY
jgi:hypothetical protein